MISKISVISIQISNFQRQRVVEFQKALILYAEAKIKTACDISALIAKDLSTLKQMELSKGTSQWVLNMVWN